jgi:hypothetical protein
MPQLSAAFASQCKSALSLASAGELARASSARGSVAYTQLHPARLETLYEAAYLRVFIAWETFLEESLVRYLCGYAAAWGQEVLQPGLAYQGNIAVGRTFLYAGADYILWHNPDTIVKRAKKCFVGGKHETVPLSNLARLKAFAAIRHRIAHGQDDARTKFDAATMGLTGRRYRGSRPGSFLRDFVPGAPPPQRWLDSIGLEFQALAKQICS